MEKSNKYKLDLVSKSQCQEILSTFHYLGTKFKSGYNYGLIRVSDNKLCGICIFTTFPVPELAKGIYGLERTDQKGLFELSRLCLIPEIQQSEYNITSWFVSRCIKQLRKDTYVRSILSYADADVHTGTIYRACNFAYYGLSEPKKDFWVERPDGTFIKHQRGKVKGLKGEWRPRSRKHRFLMTFDKKLKVKWEKA